MSGIMATILLVLAMTPLLLVAFTGVQNIITAGCFVLGLFVDLIAMKLTHRIDWSWWWVMAPLWTYLPLYVLGGMVYAAMDARSSGEHLG